METAIRIHHFGGVDTPVLGIGVWFCHFGRLCSARAGS